jgi:hypothetical protein
MAEDKCQRLKAEIATGSRAFGDRELLTQMFLKPGRKRAPPFSRLRSRGAAARLPGLGTGLDVSRLQQAAERMARASA